MTKIVAWKELSRERISEHFGHGVDKVIYEMPTGGTGDFYITNLEGAPVCIVALTPDNKVILARQYRPGPNKILNELPGGGAEPGEELAVAMKRELLEETGYEGDIELAGVCFDDAYSNIERYVFVARNCHKVAEIRQTDTENTEVVLVSIEELRQQLRSGQMTDVEVGYMGLDYLGLL